MDLKLRFGADEVGVAEGAFCSDRTWHALFRPSPDMPPRVRGYIAFCVEWHERLRAERTRSAGEFDAWADVHSSPEWRACNPDGQAWPVEGPVFIEGDVTWGGQSDAEPSAAPDGDEHS